MVAGREVMGRRYRRPAEACQAPPVDLDGTWLATVADEELRRTFAAPAFDDAGWTPVEVPGHWRSTPALGATDGPVLHRRRFELEAPPPGVRSWLVLDGVFQLADVWLDGAYLGPTEGYFRRHTFEVSGLLAHAGGHTLAVEVACPPSERGLTGAYQHDDPAWNPGGIWRPVRVERTGAVRARSLRVLCRDADEERAVVALGAELDTDVARTVTLRTSVGPHTDVAERPLAVGSNFVEWTVTVPEPRRWWPRALGPADLEELVLEVVAEDEVSHELRRPIGLRRLSMDGGVLRVNGERLHLKGAVAGPARLDPAAASVADLGAVVDGAAADGVDLLRLRGHVARPELYDAADRAGLLLWQDLGLVGDLPRALRRRASAHARTAVDLLGHHPSLAIWCVHDGGRENAVLDRAVRRALEKADGTRPVRNRVDDEPDERDVARLGRLLPRAVRFRTGVDGRAAAQLRRLKYRPNGGFLLDPSADREAACRPVAVAADRLPTSARPGDALALDVHVVSDERRPVDGARVDGTLTWAGGSHRWRWEGDVPADACVRVGTMQVVVPDATGSWSLELCLSLPGRPAVDTWRDQGAIA
jgi:beta-galactosidase/beta-glucuronidase